MARTLRQKITDTIVKSLPIPKSGNKIYYDHGDKAVAGFGIRITTGGSRSFILNYRTRGGRERRFTIGAFPDWKTAAARNEAAAMKARIRLQGEDPLAALEADRDAKTVADLTKRFLTEHSERKNRSRTTTGYSGMIDRWILPKLKHLKVSEVTFSDIDGLHAHVTKEGGPYVANRVLAVLSKMFNLSIKWQWRIDNPARGVERNQEEKRKRYLNPRKGELEALSKALEAHEDKQAADIIRLLLLTGARRGEVLNARWEQFDLTDGVWTKPAAATKQKTDHRVPLSAPARQLLADLYAAAEAEAKKKKTEISSWVFPGRLADQPRENIKRAWDEIRKAAGIEDVRVHDLRHSYASILVSGGVSLPTIGALLGHTQPATTARYAHLHDDPLRAATEKVGAIVDAGKKPAAEIVDITRGR
jgi:integrase